MRRTIQIFFTSIGLLSVLSLASEALAQERNVKSSCRLFSTSGVEYNYERKGKCVIKTYLDGDYLMVEVKTPWDSAVQGKPDLMRLENKSSCTSWQYASNDCSGEFWYGDEWSYIQATEGEKNGRTNFGYSLGNAYIVTYDGPLPRP